MDCETAELLLDAALDDELDPIQSAQLEAHLANCPLCTARLARARRLQEALRSQLPYYRAPASLRPVLPAAPARRWKHLSAALAAALFVAVGLLAWTLLSRPTSPAAEMQLAEAIEADHLRSLLSPENLTAVLSSDQHTVKPWFIGKLPYTPPVHDLAAEGFPLLGARLDILNHQPVAALVYRRNKHLVNLFVWPAAGDARAAFLTTPRGYHLLHWTTAGMEFWAASDMEESQLDLFARSLRSAEAGSAMAPATAP